MHQELPLVGLQLIKKIILFPKHGRLGNQLLQYLGACQYFSQDLCLLLGFSSLAEFVDPQSLKVRIYSSLTCPAFFRFLLVFLRFCATYRILGVVTENTQCSKYSIDFERGLIPFVYVAKSIYFQHKEAIDLKRSILPLIKSTLIDEADNWIKNNVHSLFSTNLTFIHIRRGDYLNWPSKSHPAVLPLEWYKKAINYIEDRVESPCFIVFTDDYYYVRDFFNYNSNIVVSSNSELLDLALMSRCHHGILSASSFSMVASLYSRHMIRENPINYYLAPYYWAGIRMKEWYPSHMKINFLIYLPLV